MTTPVGPDFGLEPRLDHTVRVPPPLSRDLLEDVDDYRLGTELGGVAGLIQPPPHVPDAGERLMMVYAIDPADDGNHEKSVIPPDLTGNF